MSKNIIIKCPHCDRQIEVIELNCCIFRCGIYQTTFEQIHPHLSKPECDRLFNENLIYGCGKPFRVNKLEDGTYVSVICDYV